MRLFALPQLIMRMSLILGVLLVLPTPLHSLAQDATPTAAVEEAAPVAAPGALQISIYGNNGMPLSGSFAVNDSAGVYQQVEASNGFAAAANVAAGPATVSQLSSAIDYAPDATITQVDIPAGGTASIAITNLFLDADGDGIGDSMDVCPAGNDLVDSDADGIADACDTTPFGDPTAAPTAVPTSEPTTVPTVVPTVEPTIVPTMIPTSVPTVIPTIVPTSQPTQVPTIVPTVVPTAVPTEGPVLESTPGQEETTVLSVEVAAEPVTVEVATVSCQDAQAVSPWITSDLEDYPPGGLVTLSSGSWVPGQVVELLIEDDGIADAEMGEWNHATTVTADSTGSFSYSFNIAPWFVADYSVVATGECAEARTTFTDSVSGGTCFQVGSTDVVMPGQYVTFRCTTTKPPIRISVSSPTSGWQWAYQFSDSTSAPLPTNWADTALGDSSASGSVGQVYVFIRPSVDVLPGAEGVVTIQIKDPSGKVVESTSTLSASRAVATTDFSLSCTPASSTVSVPGQQTISCSLNAINIAPAATVAVTVPALVPPTGWSVSTPSPATGSVTQGVPFLFSFALSSTCNASTSAQQVTVSTNLTFRTQALAGPSTTVSIARFATTNVSAAITGSSLSWSRVYSMSSYPVTSGSLTYSVQATGCAGWNINVAASPFVYSGTGYGTDFPSSNFSLTGASLPNATGLSTPVTVGTLDTPRKVLAASPNNGIGTFSQTLNLNLSIPANTVVGTYTSTVTITAASGP